MLAFCEATEKLMAGRTVEYPLEFFGYADWDDVKVAVNFEEGAELAQWVGLVQKYGVDELKRVLSCLPKDGRGAKLVLSTGHRAKGLEWPRVRLADDFLIGVRLHTKDGRLLSPAHHAEELRLLYVAATRAQERLSVPWELTDKLIALGANKSGLADAKVSEPDDAEIVPMPAPATVPIERSLDDLETSGTTFSRASA
jgi:superfamily I DNA/RNA helicase